METNREDQRGNFVMEFLSGQWSMTELCERFGVSRETSDKWIRRYRTEGAAGLEDRSRARSVATTRKTGRSFG